MRKLRQKEILQRDEHVEGMKPKSKSQLSCSRAPAFTNQVRVPLHSIEEMRIQMPLWSGWDVAPNGGVEMLYACTRSSRTRKATPAAPNPANCVPWALQPGLIIHQLLAHSAFWFPSAQSHRDTDHPTKWIPDEARAWERRWAPQSAAPQRNKGPGQQHWPRNSPQLLQAAQTARDFMWGWLLGSELGMELRDPVQHLPCCRREFNPVPLGRGLIGWDWA